LRRQSPALLRQLVSHFGTARFFQHRVRAACGLMVFASLLRSHTVASDRPVLCASASGCCALGFRRPVFGSTGPLRGVGLRWVTIGSPALRASLQPPDFGRTVTYNNSFKPTPLRGAA